MSSFPEKRNLHCYPLLCVNISISRNRHIKTCCANGFYDHELRERKRIVNPCHDLQVIKVTVLVTFIDIIGNFHIFSCQLIFKMLLENRNVFERFSNCKLPSLRQLRTRLLHLKSIESLKYKKPQCLDDSTNNLILNAFKYIW